MKNTFVVFASILQFIAVILFIGVIKGATGLATGTTDLPTFIGILALAIIFQGLSYSLSKRHPKESAKANKIMNQPKNSYGFFALLFFVITISFFLTFILDEGLGRFILQAVTIWLGVVGTIIIFHKKKN